MPNQPRAIPEARAHDSLDAGDPLAECTVPLLIIVNHDFSVVLASQGLGEGLSCPEFVDNETRRLVPSLDAMVRALVASWPTVDRHGTQSLVFLPPSYCLVRVTPLHGDALSFMAITIERRRHRDHFARAARIYSLSPRETEVLSLVLEGASAAEIGSTLAIAESTVQGYFKHLLSKTRSRNRTAMVAKVLGWDGLSYDSSGASHIA